MNSFKWCLLCYCSWYTSGKKKIPVSQLLLIDYKLYPLWCFHLTYAIRKVFVLLHLPWVTWTLSLKDWWNLYMRFVLWNFLQLILLEIFWDVLAVNLFKKLVCSWYQLYCLGARDFIRESTWDQDNGITQNQISSTVSVLMRSMSCHFVTSQGTWILNLFGFDF